MNSVKLWLDSPAFFFFATGALTLLVGSFLNVVIYRLPVMLQREWTRQHQATTHDQPFNLAVPRSRCPHCAHTITAFENIPILSFIWLRGRCSACGERISWRYPIVEALTAALSIAVVWHFGVSLPALAALVLTWGLIALAVVDIGHQILPDAIVLPLIWVGLLVNLSPYSQFVPLQSAVAGAIAGYVSLWLLFHIFKLLTGKEGMGYGDFKLFAASGAWLGWQSLPLVILLASFAGAVLGIAVIILGRDRRLPIPFGPFLCAATWIVLVWDEHLMRIYLWVARLA